MAAGTSARTEQEQFWAGEFGDDYIARNRSAELIAANTAFFSRILRSAGKVDSVIEFGANIGCNLMALRTLLPTTPMAGVEINQKAADELRKLKGVEVFPVSIFEFHEKKKWDLTLSKGVLIHINPDRLKEAYARLYENSSRYICVAEYYNPSPTTIPYRNHSDRLFKRDFAGEMLEIYPDLKLVDYGFAYRRDTHFPQDDITWFLLEKKQ